MKSDEHKKYINSKIWKAKRQQALAHHGCECASCGATEDIQVHHISYLNLNRKGPGKETMEDLIPLCKRHHHLVHALIEEYRQYNKKRHDYNWEKASKEAINYLVPRKYMVSKAKRDKSHKRGGKSKAQKKALDRLKRGIGCARGSNLKYIPNK